MKKLLVLFFYVLCLRFVLDGVDTLDIFRKIPEIVSSKVATSEVESSESETPELETSEVQSSEIESSESEDDFTSADWEPDEKQMEQLAYVETTSGAGRMEELEDLYPGCRVVDAEYDCDMTYGVLCKAIEEHEDVIIIYRGAEEVLSGLMRFWAMSDFQYFWLDTWTYTYGQDYNKVEFRYLFGVDETERIAEQIDSIYWDIQYDVIYSTDGSPWSAAKYVHDYLAREVSFASYAGPNIRNIYGALIEESAVCTGYTAAFDYIMSRMGYQVGVAGNSSHVWNYMCWDSDDRFIDVTWGDQDSWDVYGDYYVDYSYMGLDFNELQALEDHNIEYCYISGRGYYGSELGSSYYYGGYIANYCDLCGYNAGCYSYETIRDIFYRQFCQDSNSLIVKFSDTYALNTAVNELTSYDCDTLGRILLDIGYCGNYMYLHHEASNTFVVYLYSQ